MRWTAPPLPEFFWRKRSEVTRPALYTYTPDLGCAWYTGFVGDPPSWDVLLEDALPTLKSVYPHIVRGLQHFALKERLFAVRNGHTAVRLSALRRLAGYHPSIRGSTDQLVVLRGKVDLNTDMAREILEELPDWQLAIGEYGDL